jgi:sporulation protein YlmC with PRC-barrel domain
MRNTIIAVASVLTIASSAVCAQAASSETGARAGASGVQAGAPDGARASDLINQDVQTRGGESIGRIEELLVDRQSGRVRQVVVGVGGFLGLGEKSVALQWDRLQIAYEMKRGGGSQPPALGGDPAAAPRGTTGNTDAATKAGQALVGGDASASSPGAAPTGAEQAPRTTPARRAGVSTADLRIVVDMTKEQLQAAPEYRGGDEDARGTSRTDRSTSGAPAGARQQ